MFNIEKKLMLKRNANLRRSRYKLKTYYFSIYDENKVIKSNNIIEKVTFT